MPDALYRPTRAMRGDAATFEATCGAGCDRVLVTIREIGGRPPLLAIGAGFTHDPKTAPGHWYLTRHAAMSAVSEPRRPRYFDAGKVLTSRENRETQLHWGYIGLPGNVGRPPQNKTPLSEMLPRMGRLTNGIGRTTSPYRTLTGRSGVRLHVRCPMCHVESFVSVQRFEEWLSRQPKYN